MIPPRFAPIVIALFLSGMMSFLVSGVATARAIGFPSSFLSDWLGAWLMAWAIAFPTLLVCRPLVTWAVMRFTADS